MGAVGAGVVRAEVLHDGRAGIRLALGTGRGHGVLESHGGHVRWRQGNLQAGRGPGVSDEHGGTREARDVPNAARLGADSNSEECTVRQAQW